MDDLMNLEDKEVLNEQERQDFERRFNEQATKRAKTLLMIRTKPVFNTNEDGMELNDGYDFDMNGALPEIADAIAKFAYALDSNGFDKGSGAYFVRLISSYFDKLSNN